MAVPHLIQTKIMPPGLQPRTLARARLNSLLAEASNYRLTLLQAGAGYGKSTALAALAGQIQPLIWYQVSEEDGDPLIFLFHLFHATRVALPELPGLPIQALESWDVSLGDLTFTGIIDQYLNALHRGLPAPTLLVIDDIHLILNAAEIAHLLDRLIGLAPVNLHIFLSTRPILKLPNLSRWRARGEVLIIDQSVLAFTTDEIADLFSKSYGYELTQEEAESLSVVTEGWAIALQLIWQNLRIGATSSIENALNLQAASLEGLFEVLAHEVLEQQPRDVQEFMIGSATLRAMTPPACNALLQTGDSAAMLSYLRRQELFVVDLGEDSLRYHHIFHSFLQQLADPQQADGWHQRAAAYYLGRQDFDSAIYHLLNAKDFKGAAKLLDSYGGQLLAMGRLKSLARYLDALPPETLRFHPALLFFLGDLARLHSRFQEALGWYQQAEALWREQGQLDGVSRSLRGQARVYLDTVNPRKAEELLQQALRLSDGAADREVQARLYELLAENKLNAGKPDQARSLQQQAESLRRAGPADSQLMIRVLLRTGHLKQAQAELEQRVEMERSDPIHVPRAHRETLLLLSLIHALQGNAAEAYQTALDGTQRALAFDSPYMTGVGHMRQGHALMLLAGKDRYAQARQQFEKAIEISRSLAIPRLRVEACWGLCRALGYQGDLTTAAQVAEEGIQIATQAGDEWVASLARVAMGASCNLYARYEAAAQWLTQAARGFHECSDPFGYTAARLWLCLGWFRQNDGDRLAQTFPEVLAACQEQGYDFLFTRPSLLGPPSERLLAPLLIFARERGWEAAYATKLLETIGLAEIAIHPGYRLRVSTLGSFQVWRGDQPIPPNHWRREKTRHLFQLLLTFRAAPLEREQIFEHLWPEAEVAAAQRNFKVALNTLFNVLEPERNPGSESAYIQREGSGYRLRPGADLWLDADEFTACVQAAETLASKQPEQAIRRLERAVELWQGEYLPDTRYESWLAAEREYLAVLFLRAADQLCELYLQRKRSGETIDLCYRILAQDNCWERAYRHLMIAYDQLGERGQIARTYQRCAQTLHTELEVSPSNETEHLYHQLTSKAVD